MDDRNPGDHDPEESPGLRQSRIADHRRHLRDAVGLVAESGKQVDQDATPEYEETEEELHRSFLHKVLRTVGGFMLIGLGIALLPLPGPGWVIIIVGLTLLPFAWAEKTILRIRRTIPGIPEEGRIPVHTWIIMGVMVVAGTLLAMKFGGRVGDWLAETWSGLWN